MNTDNYLVEINNDTQLVEHVTFKVFQNKTIREVIDEFLNMKISEQTKRAYKSDVTSFFEKQKITFLRELSQIPYHEMVRFSLDFINSFKKTEKYHTNKILNPKTVNRKAYSLSAFFKFLVNVYNYPKNPVVNFVPLKIQRRSNTASLNKNEIFEILQFAKAESHKSEHHCRNYLLLSFLFMLALRRNEIANLRWNDIDFDRQSINVFQKGGSYKELPIPDNLLKLLMDFRKEYGKPSQYIFHPVTNNRTKSTVKPISTDLIFKVVKNIAVQVVPHKKITPHSFRKTFIEFALNNNQDFISILNATGHTSIEMIKYYDTRDTLKNNAVNSMSDFI